MSRALSARRTQLASGATTDSGAAFYAAAGFAACVAEPRAKITPFPDPDRLCFHGDDTRGDL